MTPAIDLLVVGAGPAGASLAALAASAGARTLLLERASFPRDKVCGEFVAAEGQAVLRRLGVLEELERAGAAAIDACRITDRRGRPLDLAVSGTGVSRSLLDSTLLARAARSGAEVRERVCAREPIVRAGRVCGFRVRAVGSGSTESLEAAVVVAADGRHSALARFLHPQLGDPRTTDRRSWFGIKSHLTVEHSSGRVELHLFDGGYAGLAPVEGGRVNLCALTTAGALRACGGSPARLFAERFRGNPALREAVLGAAPATPWSSCGPLRFAPRRAAAAGAIFVGDAAGTVDPFCGAGMTNALIGAEIALPFVLDAVARGGLSEAGAWAYDDAWRATFAPVARRVRALGALFGRPRLAAFALAALRSLGGGLVPRLAAATRIGSGR